MIDFTPCPRNKFKAYGGANGNKINITYEEQSYMLKFSPKASKNKAMSYANSCVSEHIACRIFESLGFNAQETILGTYTTGEQGEFLDRRKVHTVVACKDFETADMKLMEFAQLKNTCVDSLQGGYGTELNSVLKAIYEQELVPSFELETFFWDMFIVDALLGNFDRHNGNWGILVDEKNKSAEIAPIYDCGSCLYPQIMPTDMERILKDQSEIDKRIFVYPTSMIKEENKKLNYFDYISSHENADCTKALIRIAKKIDMKKIDEIINQTPSISSIQKEFYKAMIRKRKDRIIDFSLEKMTR